MYDPRPSVVLVKRPTRLEGMVARFGTVGQAAFGNRQAKVQERMRAGQIAAAIAAQKAPDEDFEDLQDEDNSYRDAVSFLRRELDLGFPIHVIERGFVPRYQFANCEAVVVVGQDGLVANVAKYVGDKPVIGVNPDPQRFDGVLLPFSLRDARVALQRTLARRARVVPVTLAEAVLHDGQRLLAFNDFFVGVSSHASARYTLTVDGRSERQSSSGMIVSTGAGSTGWMSSVLQMAAGVSAAWGMSKRQNPPPVKLDWSARELLWAVREPFVSRTSTASLAAGRLPEGRDLTIESDIATGGVIFSDGVESDFLPFLTGTIARIGVAKQQARLVVG